MRSTCILIKEGSYQGSESTDVFWVIRERIEPRLCEIGWLKQYAEVAEFKPGSAYQMICESEEGYMPDIQDKYPWGGTSLSPKHVVSLSHKEDGEELKSPQELGPLCPHIVYDANNAAVELNALPEGSELLVTCSSYLPGNCFYLRQI